MLALTPAQAISLGSCFTPQCRRRRVHGPCTWMHVLSSLGMCVPHHSCMHAPDLLTTCLVLRSAQRLGVLTLHAALALVVVAAALQLDADPTTSALCFTFAYLTLAELFVWILKACVAALTVNGFPEEVCRRKAQSPVPGPRSP